MTTRCCAFYRTCARCHDAPQHPDTAARSAYHDDRPFWSWAPRRTTAIRKTTKHKKNAAKRYTWLLLCMTMPKGAQSFVPINRIARTTMLPTTRPIAHQIHPKDSVVPSHGGFAQRQPFLPMSTSSFVPSFDGWRAGEDVHGDLDRLERGIRISNAPQHLSRSYRLQCLDYLAQQKKPVASLTPRMVQLTLRTVLMWGMLQLWGASRHRSLRTGIRAVGLVASVHFWVALVWLPVALLWMVRRRHDTTEDHRPRRAFFIPIWRDPFEYSSHDVARHILEHWIASVAGLALAYPWIPSTKVGACDWQTLARLLVRLAVPVSWRLYEKMWFLLHRPLQARPLTWTTQLMQSVTRNVLFTPWAVSWELALLLYTTKVSTPIVVGLFGTVLAMAWACQSLPFLSEKTNTKNILPHKLPIKRATTIGLTLLIMQWACNQRQLLTSVYKFLGQTRQNMVLPELLPLFKRFTSFACIVTACLTPSAYIIARLGRLRFSYTSSISLNSQLQTAEQTAEGSRKQSWRYRYEWMDQPERVGEIVRKLRNNVLYKAFLEGSVQEKMRKKDIERNSDFVRARGLHVLDRIKDDLKRKPEAFALDRTMWKRRSMDRMTQIHEYNYAQNVKDDPLGLALFLTCDVPLGFKFDQLRQMSEGDKLTNRRLQARAAKSAIYRARALRNPEAARKILDSMSDPIERKRKAKELVEQSESEIKKIAQRLVELVPTDKDIYTPPLSLYGAPDYKRVSQNEYVKSGDAANLNDLLRQTVGNSADSVMKGDFNTHRTGKSMGSLLSGDESSNWSVERTDSFDNLDKTTLTRITSDKDEQLTGATAHTAEVDNIPEENSSRTRAGSSSLPPEVVKEDGMLKNQQEESMSAESDDEFIEAWMQNVLNISGQTDDDDIALC